GSSDVIPPAAPALPELALDERLAAESGAAQDLTGASAGTSAPEYADTDEAAVLLAASTVSEPAPATGNADNAWNTWLYALLAIAAVVLAVAAGWVYR